MDFDRVLQVLAKQEEQKKSNTGKILEDIVKPLIDPMSSISETLAFEEGFRPTIYEDKKGIPTVGFGFKVDDDLSRKFLPKEVLSGKRELKKEEALVALRERAKQARLDAERFVGRQTFKELPMNAQHVLTDMAYNIGLGKLNKFEKMRTALQSGDLNKAAIELMDSKYAREDVPNRALRNKQILLGQPIKQVYKEYY